MKQHILAAAVLGAVALPLYADQPAAAGSDATVSFIDGPTGFNFIWRPDSGWRFVGKGQQGRAAAVPSKDGFQEGAPLAEFVDASTGFRFLWRNGAGWEFAGMNASQHGDAQQLAATTGGDLR